MELIHICKTFRVVNFDKLAYGASIDHIVDEVRLSGRYCFVKASLMDREKIENVLIENQVGDRYLEVQEK